MPNTDTAAVMPGRTGPPWIADGTVYFFGGWLSNFAPTLGLRLPFGYHGHHEHDRVPLRGKFELEPYRSALLLTHPHPLAEDSPSDFVWGARDRDGGYGGLNLLGLALMRVRDELIADVRTRVAALAAGR
jgi:hypothetical protein